MSSRKRGDAKSPETNPGLKRIDQRKYSPIFSTIIFIQIQEMNPESISKFCKFSIASFSFQGKSVNKIIIKTYQRKEWQERLTLCGGCAAGLYFALEEIKMNKMNCNVLPESDEEFEQDLAQFAESLFEMGRKIPSAKYGSYDNMRIEDPSFLDIYLDIGLKNKMSAKSVRNYIYITMRAMLEKADPDMNEHMQEALRAAYGKKSKVPTVEDFILFMYAMLRRGESMLGI